MSRGKSSNTSKRARYHNDAESVWLQVTSGQGPQECGLVVAQVTKAILKEAEQAGLNACVIESLAFDKLLRKQTLIEPDAYRSVLLKIEGSGSNQFASSWLGSIKWQGESTEVLKKGRANHKRNNWFVGVVQQLVDASTIAEEEIQTKDLSFEAIRSSGPGGQHVNKTSSAVRLTHLPTGTQVRVDAERSQHRNKQLAIKRLKMILAQGKQNRQKEEVRDRWLNHYQVSRGNPIRTFVGNAFIEKC